MIRQNLPAILLLYTFAVLGTAAAHAESFDKPLEQKVVDLGRSKNLMPDSKEQIQLTCSYYPHFMVKELGDPGLKGSVFVSITPTDPRQLPPCTRTHGPEEEVIAAQDQSHWFGRFGGVKRNLIFLYAADGDVDGGIRFAAFDPKTTKKVFEDSVKLSEGGDNDLHFAPSSDTQITLLYSRVVMGDCSVPAGGNTCWSRIEQKAGLKDAPLPRCTDYEGAEAGKTPSAIAYPVEVSLFPKPSIRALANPVKCWPMQ
jgi:hypothetical protein